MSDAPTVPAGAELASAEIYYPESDGKPMAESDVHRRVMIDLSDALIVHYRDVPDVYVSANLLLYYVPGNPRRSISPDVLVTKGIPKGDRPIYRVWVEGKAPDVVIEVTSPSTRREDLRTKYRLYARLGVREYFLFDPLGEYLDPPLQGYRLQNGEYEPIEPDADGALLSEELDRKLRPRGKTLRLVDPITDEETPTHFEERDARLAEAQARRIAEARAVAEAEARRAAKARTAQLEAEVARLRAELQRRRGELA